MSPPVGQDDSKAGGLECGSDFLEELIGAAGIQGYGFSDAFVQACVQLWEEPGDLAHAEEQVLQGICGKELGGLPT